MGSATLVHSRLGLPRLVLDLEKRLADFIGVEDVMVFPTVTLLHIGVMPVLAGPEGSIFIDSTAHTSMQEAATLARGKGTAVSSFKHGDLNDLETRLKAAASKTCRLIVVDGVYLTSGATLELDEYRYLAEKYDCLLYVDDVTVLVSSVKATAETPFGHRGNGVVKHRGLDYDRTFYVAGLGKAFSTTLAFISCPSPQYRYMFHTASTVIFGHLASTASLAQANAVLDLNDTEGDFLRDELRSLIARLIQGAQELGFRVRSDNSAIVNIIAGDIDSLILATNVLWDDGIKITPAMFPAVPLDEGGLRFTVTASNTNSDC